VIERNPEHNLQLLPGDVVTIFGVNDVPVPLEKRTRFVTVGGEVRIPGVYQLKPGDTLSQIIQRAGGFTSLAYPYGLVFTRESNRIQQQAQLDKALHEMELEVSKLALSRAQNSDTSGGSSSLASDVAMQQQLLNAMKRVKPSGRVALELEAARVELPSLLLEDGDKITVPPRPSFVGVYGAVFADSSLLHRPHYTVNDYLKAAGLKRDADTENALIIRADGSVVGSSSNTLFGMLGGQLSSPISPGDSIYVPEKFDRETAYNKFIRGAKDWTSILYQLSLGAAAIKTLRD
jgi:protein involved in polysaccharide export with SLBB domain